VKYVDWKIWLVFEILEIVENFIRITYTLYVDLIEILNSQLMYNFSLAERQQQEVCDIQQFLGDSTFLVCRHMLLLSRFVYC
jgi:hypothetical protein